MVFVLEIIGTIAFAISGAMVAIQKKMDILGVAVLGMTTAVGGGIFRDLILGQTPPVAFLQPVYALVALVTALLTFLPFIRKHMNTDHPIFVFLDSVGLGIFTVVGAGAGAGTDNLFLQIFLGTVTGVGGGVVRDVFASEKPFIFVKHFYACASILGAVAYTVMTRLHVSRDISMVAGAALVVVIRTLAAKFKWHLPKA